MYHLYVSLPCCIGGVSRVSCCRCVVDVGSGVRHHRHLRLFSHQLRLLPRVVRRPHGSVLPDHVRVHADDVPHGTRQRAG